MTVYLLTIIMYLSGTMVTFQTEEYSSEKNCLARASDIEAQINRLNTKLPNKITIIKVDLNCAATQQ